MGARFGQSGSYLMPTTSVSSVTMAKSAMSVRITLAIPVGDVEPTIARPGAPLSLRTSTKSFAMRLAARSAGSARTENVFTAWDCGAALALGGWDCGAAVRQLRPVRAPALRQLRLAPAPIGRLCGVRSRATRRATVRACRCDRQVVIAHHAAPRPATPASAESKNAPVANSGSTCTALRRPLQPHAFQCHLLMLRASPSI